jgi:uridine kinase
MVGVSPSRAAVLERLADRVAGVQLRHTARVAIEGVDAAGKTTLADELEPLLVARGRSVLRATVDDFHRPRSERHRRGPTSPEGYYRDAFDYEALRRELLVPLGPGGGGRYRTRIFDRLADAPVSDPPAVAPSDGVLLVDGVFLLRPELNDLWDLRILVEVDADEALRRAVLRDEDLFGSPDEALRRYRNRYVPGQRLYAREADPAASADIVLENTDVASPTLRASSLH